MGRFNATAVAYPAGETLLTLFARQVARTPAGEAVRFEGESLSYAELDARSNQLGRWLAAQGVGPEAVVGVLAERSLELLVALYGVLKAGAAWLPLEPDAPPQRLTAILEEARPAAVLFSAVPRVFDPAAGRLRRSVASATELPQSRGYAGVTLAVDQQWAEQVAALPATPPEVELKPEHVAYVLYTSGSTGTPKGALITHAAIVNRLRWMQAYYGLTERDRVLQKTPIGFDVSVWELFWPLQCGAALVVARPGGHKDPAVPRRTDRAAADHDAALRALDAGGVLGGSERAGTAAVCGG